MLNKKMKTKSNKEVMFETMGGMVVKSFKPDTLYTCEKEKNGEYYFKGEYLKSRLVEHLSVPQEEFEKIKDQLIIV